MYFVDTSDLVEMASVSVFGRDDRKKSIGGELSQSPGDL